MLKCFVIVLCASAIVFCAPGFENSREKQSARREHVTYPITGASRKKRQSLETVDIVYLDAASIDPTKLKDLQSKESSRLAPVNDVTIPGQNFQQLSETNLELVTQNSNYIVYKLKSSGDSPLNGLPDDKRAQGSDNQYYGHDSEQYSGYSDERNPPPDHHPPPPPPPPHHHPPPPPPHHYPPPPPPHHHPPPPPPDDYYRSNNYGRYNYYNRPPPPPPPRSPYDDRSRRFYDERQTRQSSYDRPPPPHRGGPPPHYGGPPHDRGPPPHDGGRPPRYDGHHRGPPPDHGGPPRHHGGPPPRDGPPDRYDHRPPPHHGGPPDRFHDRPPPPRDRYDHRPPPPPDRYDDRPPYDRRPPPPPNDRRPPPDRGQNYDQGNGNKEYFQNVDNSGKLIDATQTSSTTEAATGDDQYQLDVRFIDDEQNAAEAIKRDVTVTTARPFSPFIFQAAPVTPEA